MALAMRYAGDEFNPDEFEHSISVIYPTDRTTHLRLVKPPYTDFIRLQYGTIKGTAHVFQVEYTEDIPLASYGLEGIVVGGYWHIGEVHRLIKLLRLATLYDLSPEGRIILPVAGTTFTSEEIPF